MLDANVVILAAGEGTRMKSSKSKVLCEVLFKPMISWVTDSCKEACYNDSQICIVCPEFLDPIKNATDNKFNYVIQKDKLGTGHAVLQALEFLESNKANETLIMLGDAPFISGDILNQFYENHIKANNNITIMSAHLDNPLGYGRIVRNENDDEVVSCIVEEADCSKIQKGIKEVNSGVLLFKTDDLFYALDHLDNCNAKNEFYITQAIEILISRGKKVGAFLCEDRNVVLGANTKSQLLEMNIIARDKVISELLEKGVNFISKEGVFVSPDAEIGVDTTIYPNVIVKGKSKIGNCCIITSGSIIENSKMGNGCMIKSSYILDSNIADNVSIGPFSNIRPNCNICDNVKIGDFVEVKNSYIGKKTSIAHLTYVGDSEIGDGVNVGCGCVTVNYDGQKKHKTIIEDNAFIGCNTNLVAPVKIGEGAYTAAGSTITEDVPNNSLAIARSRQINKDNWKK